MDKSKKGFSMLITSLRGDERGLLEDILPEEESTFSLPYAGNFQLWQAFHIDLQSKKNPDAAMAYVKRKSAWLTERYENVSKEKENGYLLKSASDFILRDICLPLLSGIDRAEVLSLYKPVLDQIDHVVFVDWPLKNQGIQSYKSFFGDENLSPIRKIMLDLCKEFGWKIIHLQYRKLKEQDVQSVQKKLLS